MNKLEILNEIKKRNLEIAATLDLIAEEKRELKNVEKINIESAKAEILNLEAQLKATPEVEVKKETRSAEEFNLVNAINDFVQGKGMSEATIKMNEIGKRSFQNSGLTPKGHLVLPFQYNERANLNTSTSESGAELVTKTYSDSVIGALRNNLVLAGAGAQVLTGLVGELVLPTYGGSSVTWEGENAEAQNGKGATGSLTMKPKRLTAYLPVSKQLLNQSSYDVQAMLINDINAAIAEKLEASILGSFSGSTTQPKGLLDGVATTSVTTSYAEFLGLESTLNTANVTAGKFAYVVHPNVNAKLKGTAAFTNGSVSIASVLSHPILVTSAMPSGAGSSKGTLFANWSDLVIGQWGAVDIVIDPYTLATTNEIRLVINVNFDWAMKRAASITGKYYA